MLSDEVLEKVSERLVDRIESANTYILKKIGSNIDEIGKLGYSDAQKIAQMMKYGGDYEKIIKKLASVTNLNEKDIRDIFDEVAKSEYEFAEQFYRFKNINYVPYNENRALREQVEALASITQRNISNMMKPNAIGYGIIDKVSGNYTLVDLQQAYYNLIDEAVFSVGQGKETFNEAMTRQIKEMISGGLKVIYNSTYVNKEGNIIHRSRRLDSAIRMTMKDGLRTLHNEMQDRFGNEFGANGVEVSVHLNPAPDHADMQGHQFKKEEYEKLQLDGVAKDYKGRVIDIHRELKDGTTTEDFRPVSQYNCYHYVFSIVLGISKPAYSQEDLDRINELNNRKVEIDGKEYTGYECTQLQRRLETKIREQKDAQIIARAGNKKDLVIEAQQKITELTNKYKEISDKAGLKTKMDRLKVSGYRYIPYKKKDVDVVNKVENKPVVNVKVNKDKNNKIFISKEEQLQRINYKKEYIKEQIENKKDMLSGIPENSERNWDISHRKILQSDIKKYEKEIKLLNEKDIKDKTIDINTREGCVDLLKEVNIELQEKNLNKIDIDVVRENSLHYYEVVNKYPFLEQSLQEQKLKLSFDNLPGGTIGLAEKGGSKIELDISNYMDKKDLIYWGKSQTNNGYNMSCSKENYINYFATHELGHSFNYRVINNVDINGLEDLSAREFYQKTNEHFMDNIYEIAKKNTGKTKKELVSMMSDYGKTNIDEAMAELFANANCGNPNALGIAFDEYFEELLK